MPRKKTVTPPSQPLPISPTLRKKIEELAQLMSNSLNERKQREYLNLIHTLQTIVDERPLPGPKEAPIDPLYQGLCNAVRTWLRSATESYAPFLISSVQITAETITEEIQTLHSEGQDFDFRYVKPNFLLVRTTDPIDLVDEEGTEHNLGRFTITINPITRRISAKALDPNPAGMDGDVTHPYVDGGTVCLGDASTPFYTAVMQGRFVDAFDIVETTLNTYEGGVGYRNLEEWNVVARCVVCSEGLTDDDQCLCRACSRSFCEEHISSCPSCERDICLDCMPRCAACRVRHCNRCLTANLCSDCRHTCDECHDVLKAEEIENGLCENCGYFCEDCQKRVPNTHKCPNATEETEDEPKKEKVSTPAAPKTFGAPGKNEDDDE